MFYKDILQQLLKDETNSVNKMYLHEINIKWKNFEKAAESKAGFNNLIIKAINDFISSLSNKKYVYNSTTRRGFKKKSPVFSNCYLNDLISVLMSRRKILSHLGVKWGFQTFNVNLKFNPNDLCSIEKDIKFEQSYSPEMLQLTQEIDTQHRVSGKRNFRKYKTILPLIIFHTFDNLTEVDFIRTEYYANMAETTFEKSKTVIITETLDENFIPELSSSKINSIFVLRKQYKSDESKDISIEVVDTLEKKIKELLTEKDIASCDFQKTGIIN